MAAFETFPCPECGAMVWGPQRARHKDEHDALVTTLQLLVDTVNTLNLKVSNLTDRVSGKGAA